MLLKEEDRRLPCDNNITLLPGVIGAYPDAYWHIKAEQLDAFVADITKIKNEDDYSRLLATYGVRRSNPEFWKFSDQVLQSYQAAHPVEYGSLDYNRLENRQAGFGIFWLFWFSCSARASSALASSFALDK